MLISWEQICLNSNHTLPLNMIICQIYLDSIYLYILHILGYIISLVSSSFSDEQDDQ